MIEKVRSILLDPRKARAWASASALPTPSTWRPSSARPASPPRPSRPRPRRADRLAAQDRLRRREVNFLFVVDLYNEGVDIPEIDTVLFLRPTESLTVFLQQLGRGLRLYEEKECLTVLDFVGQAHRNFRFDLRYRACLTDPSVPLDEQVEHGFTHLPAGCTILMERVARQHVLENIRQSLRQTPIDAGRHVRELSATLGSASNAAASSWNGPGSSPTTFTAAGSAGRGWASRLVSASRSTILTRHDSRRDCGGSPTSPTRQLIRRLLFLLDPDRRPSSSMLTHSHG